MREYYDSLPEPWDVNLTGYQPVRKTVPSGANDICLTPQTEERLKYRRPLFAVQARGEHLDKLVRRLWLGRAAPADAATGCNRVGSILGLFWERLVAELTTHLGGWVSKTRGVRVYAVALFLEPARRGAAPLVRMARVREETDGRVRRMLYFDGFTRINLARAESHLDTKFRSTPPRAPCFRGLVEKFVDATGAAVRSAVHARTLAEVGFPRRGECHHPCWH
jgi:hypothetical protein